MIPTIHALNIVIKQPDLLENCRINIEYFLFTHYLSLINFKEDN